MEIENNIKEENWLSRTELLLGDKKLQKLQKAKVLIVGLGGVGAYAAEHLCRSGVGSLTIVDCDSISVTNRNRQLPALISTTGLLKTEVMSQRLLDINPDLNLDVVEEFVQEEKLFELLKNGNWDFVVDAIDTLSPKFSIMKTCHDLEIPSVSSMGSGGKTDPSKVQIDDISNSFGCHLARNLRKRLHRAGIRSGINVVYSSESVPEHAIQLTYGEQNKKSNVGTISYMPAIFGCCCASVGVNSITSD